MWMTTPVRLLDKCPTCSISQGSWGVALLESQGLGITRFWAWVLGSGVEDLESGIVGWKLVGLGLTVYGEALFGRRVRAGGCWSFWISAGFLKSWPPLIRLV